MHRLVNHPDPSRRAWLCVEELECRAQPSVLNLAGLGHLLNALEHAAAPSAVQSGRFAAAPEPAFSITISIRVEAAPTSAQPAAGGASLGRLDAPTIPLAAPVAPSIALPPATSGSAGTPGGVTGQAANAGTAPSTAVPQAAVVANVVVVLPVGVAHPPLLSTIAQLDAVAEREAAPAPQDGPAARPAPEPIYPILLSEVTPLEVAPPPHEPGGKADPAAPIEVAPPPRAAESDAPRAELPRADEPVAAVATADAIAVEAAPAPVSPAGAAVAEPGTTAELLAVVPPAESGSRWGWLAAAGAVAVGHWAIRTGWLKPAHEALARRLAALKVRLVPFRAEA